MVSAFQFDSLQCERRESPSRSIDGDIKDNQCCDFTSTEHLVSLDNALSLDFRRNHRLSLLLRCPMTQLKGGCGSAGEENVD